MHWPLLIVTQAAVGEQNPLGTPMKILLGIVLALPLAWLLFRIVETPLRAPRSLVNRRPRVTLWATLGVTVELVAATAGAVKWAAARDVGTGGTVAVAPSFPASPPNATGFVPRNMTPALDAVADDVAPMYADGCHFDVKREDVQDCHYADPDGALTIAVFGDSHSAQWFPAIEVFATSQGDVRIDAYTKSSCPAVDVTVLDKDVPYTSCDRWRESVLLSLVADPPDLVVISSYAGYDLADSSSTTEKLDAWAEGVESTVSRLRGAGIEVLVIADSPRFASAPATCVSANIMDVSACQGERATVLDEILMEAEQEATEAAGAEYANLTDLICGPETCPVIVDDILVYRDINHMTSTFVSHLAPALSSSLSALLGGDTGTDP